MSQIGTILGSTCRSGTSATTRRLRETLPHIWVGPRAVLPLRLRPVVPIISTEIGKATASFPLHANARESWPTKCLHGHAGSFGSLSLEGFVKDINVILRNKRVQLAELSLEIDELEAAASALRPVVHLLSDDEPLQGGGTRLAPSEDTEAIVDEAHAVPPERSRVRRWA
jgi:hypothetical protein